MNVVLLCKGNGLDLGLQAMLMLYQWLRRSYLLKAFLSETYKRLFVIFTTLSFSLACLILVELHSGIRKPAGILSSIFIKF